MSKEIRARVLLVRVPKRHIGLFSALMDGAGRKAIVRTKEGKREGMVGKEEKEDSSERQWEGSGV